jgi:hypothetical protein
MQIRRADKHMQTSLWGIAKGYMQIGRQGDMLIMVSSDPSRCFDPTGAGRHRGAGYDMPI